MSCRAVAPCVSCRVSRALTSHTRHAQVATDEQDLEDELDQVSSGTGKKKATTAAKGKGKAATKKKSRIPALELEKVPDRPKMSKTARITADAEEEGEEEGGEEEEEEGGLRRGGKRGRTSAAGKKKKKNQATTKKSKRSVVEEQEEKDDEGEGLSGEELVEEMEE